MIKCMTPQQFSERYAAYRLEQEDGWRDAAELRADLQNTMTVIVAAVSGSGVKKSNIVTADDLMPKWTSEADVTQPHHRNRMSDEDAEALSRRQCGF